MSAVKNAVEISTEHHVVFLPQKADSIHRNSGASRLLVEFDSSCSHGCRFPQITILDLYFIAGPDGPGGVSRSGFRT
eukprot:5974066-Amphidinium_carterae.1